MVRFSKFTAEGRAVYEYHGLSTDTKPMAPEGSTFYCIDKNKTYYASKYGWIDQSAKMPVSIALSGLSETQYEGVPLAGTPTVTVTYDNDTTADVTESAVIEAPEVLAAGENDVVASYVDNGIRVQVKTTVQATAKELDGIEVTTDPTKTGYETGEVFDPAGATVTATYNNGETADVTDDVTWTPAEELTTDDTAATASYTEGEITKTDSVTITVAEAE